MSGEVAIICSKADPASFNMAQRLLEIERWEDCNGYRSSGHKRLLIHEERQTTFRGLDEHLAKLGLHPKMVIFASRHESKRAVPWLGGHFTGQIKEGFSMAAPSGLRSFLHNLQNEAPEGFRISAEATHHGPIDMNTPSFFAEIGSSSEQWSDPKAGSIVARAILDVKIADLPVFLGFGGGHYVQRQTSLMFEAGIAFGHLFSSYQIESLDSSVLKMAREKSNAGYAFMDRKSLKSEEKKKLTGLIDELGIPLLRSNEIRSRFPLPE